MEDNNKIKEAFDNDFKPPRAIFKPMHQMILDNEAGRSTLEEIFVAKRHAQIEKDEAIRQNISVDELRLKKHQAKVDYNQQIIERDSFIEETKAVSLQIFGNSCFEFITEACKNAGYEFDLKNEKMMNLYREIIRYFHWDSDCEKLDKNRFLYLFGVYGCGKSVVVKSIFKALKRHRKDNWQYFHLPTLTKNYMGGHTEAFNALFQCSSSMIIDEIGDKSEKQKFYGNEIESVRSLILDKYDKWVGRSKDPANQKIIFTSNLFPDTEYFFNIIKAENDTRPTIRNFYDEKVYNKMGEMCNLVRFPNVSYRVNNKIELL